MSGQSSVIDFEGIREIIRSNPVVGSIDIRVEEGKKLTQSDREYLTTRYLNTLDKENIFITLSAAAIKLSDEDLEAYFYASLVHLYKLTADSAELFNAIAGGYLLPTDGVNYFKGTSALQVSLESDMPNKILGKMFIQTNEGLINDGREYILKYSVSSAVPTEIKKWKSLLGWGVPTPYIFLDITALGVSCMAVEQLQPLLPADYSSKLAVDIINSLERLAPHAIHSNITASSIGRREGETVYFLTGYDVLSTKPKGFGFERLGGSPLWTSQPDTGAISTARNDLLEFGFVLGFLSRWTAQYSFMSLEEEVHDVYRYPKEVQAYIERVRLIDERNIQITDFEDLRTIAATLP